MGEVYAAFDPELNRKVALKLLRGHSETPEGRARMLREAQAIAKLQHPSVVVVHDAGTIGERVFIAMEFVEGATVSAWLASARPSQREILDVYLSAGRGLAAAHARALVHRDFKPDNVMVTNDGHVRVMDFGLARQVDETSPVPPDAADVGVDTGAPLRLTQTGAFVGTPAYMAPEQFTLAQADARTDQFSFCVALYEALYGKRPFEGTTFGDLMKNVTAANVSPPPPKSRVPGWLRRVLLRGLARDPDQRFPSMSALLTALETDPTLRLKRIGIGVSLVACVAAAIGLARRGPGARGAACQEGGARWAGVWEAGGVTSPRREAIRRAFLATGQPYAEGAFAGVARVLDRYEAQWSRMYADACEATNVRAEQSEQVLDLRMGCLEERLTAARAVTDVFVNADDKVVENAVSAASELPALDRCADVPALRAIVRPPDESVRKSVEALRPETARVAALKDSGHCKEAEALANTLIPKVRTVGYKPFLADMLNVAGFLSDDCAAPEVGPKYFREAYVAGVVSRYDEAAAEAAIVLTQGYADRSQQPLVARQWFTVATATLERAGNPPRLAMWLLNAEQNLLGSEGRKEEAVRVAQKAVVAVDKLLGKETNDAGVAQNNLGFCLDAVGRFEEALRAYDAARETWGRLLGAQHPKLAMVASNSGESLNALRRYAEARVRFQTALDIWRRAGAHPQFLAYALTGLSLALLGDGKPEEAIAPAEEAVRIRHDASEGVERLSESRFALARALWSRPSEHTRALELARQARADYAKTKGHEAIVSSIDAWLAAPSARL
jgi:tetratricopeptide (TPR) repeat protein